jgi:hypothetical protein
LGSDGKEKWIKIVKGVGRLHMGGIGRGKGKKKRKSRKKKCMK